MVSGSVPYLPLLRSGGELLSADFPSECLPQPTLTTELSALLQIHLPEAPRLGTPFLSPVVGRKES